MLKLGRQSWRYVHPPQICGQGICGGRTEGQGPLGKSFDHIYTDLYAGESTFEKAEQKMQMKAAETALTKAGVAREQVDLLCAGDLLNQNTPSAFSARALGIPFFGMYTACATICQALAAASLAVACGAAGYALALAGSHTCTAEKQFRYPNEYGAQKPPSSQYTVCAAGAALLGPAGTKSRVCISGVTVGRVIDLSVCDPFNMGAVMAPAFADTLAAHLRENQRQAGDYDLILSGDLGKAGQAIALELLEGNGVTDVAERFGDCGQMLLGENKKFFCGGSGIGCAAAVGLGHAYDLLRQGKMQRILLCATGALLSPCANQQRESIPGICHGIVMERV
ncbi:MAG: stage V sporulation protein AD [Firmicutes bacterium]|nr:stage V sporulation protein AD [Bacillota bacterium]